MVLGDTGDHHFPKSQFGSERNYSDADPKQPNSNNNQQDMLLSEIAEEDSISMISERNMAGTNKHRQNIKNEINKSSLSVHSNIANVAKAEVDANIQPLRKSSHNFIEGLPHDKQASHQFGQVMSSTVNIKQPAIKDAAKQVIQPAI